MTGLSKEAKLVENPTFRKPKFKKAKFNPRYYNKTRRNIARGKSRA